MAIKHIVAQGLGFATDGIKWIVTHGFGTGGAPPADDEVWVGRQELRLLPGPEHTLTLGGSAQTLRPTPASVQRLTMGATSQTLRLLPDAGQDLTGG